MRFTELRLEEKISGKRLYKIQLRMTYKLDFENISKRFDNDPEGIKIGFFSELIEVFRVLDQSHGKINTSICNYVVIRSVSAIESFFKHFARKLVDDNDIPTSKIFPKEEKISLTKFDELKDKKITKGKIIAEITNFKDLDKINKIMSNLLDVKFFEEITKQMVSYTFVGCHETSKLQLEELYSLFDLRHEIIHEMSDFEEKPEKLKQYCGQVMIFLVVSHEIIKKYNK